MASSINLLRCCILLAIIMMGHAQTDRNLVDEDNAAAASFYIPSIASRSHPFSHHRSLGAEHYERSSPPPPPKKSSEVEPLTTGT
ncbi:PREDICTED: uncharacterized protein LOC109131351 [Camelina sativa]|uniref:Uncharacterized protein LOC109131351 n=1 Tax=Camelina sativa TaxID=90675 RepID=A0ABM1RFI9_CAMSA|nr:PREDICTED: uncharacterized protein LOC109131351 [Camelina sativa]